MKLVLIVCLSWALLNTAQSLRCHKCSNQLCTNTTSVECPPEASVCKTATVVTYNGPTFLSVTVNKSCSVPLSCITPPDIATEWSVNVGYSRDSYNQMCCFGDNCNLQTLAAPNILQNGKVCPACASSADSQAGTCNSTVDCAGVENSCFTGNTTTSSKKTLLGCISKNLCTTPNSGISLLTDFPTITCGAPWSVKISTMLLAFALALYKVLL